MANRSTARRAAIRYMGAVAAGNLVWEILQLPLYSLWRTSSAGYLAFAAVHCWVGDLMIASVALAAAILAAGRSWPLQHYRRTAALAVLFGVAYTAFSEWLNVTVRGSWAYSPAMLRVPPLGTGLSPLLQWLIVPIAAFVWARPCSLTRPHLLPIFLFLLVGLAAPAGTARAAASGWIGDAHAAARLITAVEATGSGGQLDAGLQIRLAPGWHAYWRTPGDAGVPPVIDWQGSENIASAAIAWPAPTRLVVSELQNAVYYDRVVLPIALTLSQPGAPARLHAEVDYAACAEVCVPYHASLELALPAGLAVPGPEAKLIATARAKVPGDFTAGRLRLTGAVVAEHRGRATLTFQVASFGSPLRAPDLFVEGVANIFPGRPDVMLADGGRIATLRVPIPGITAAKLAGTTLHLTIVDGARSAEADASPQLGTLAPIPGETGRAAIIGLALLGGLVLNLMPCVLPVLSLKLLALIGYAGVERRRARLGLLATAAGVVASFGALAAALILLKAAGAAIGWGIQFQLPWFLAGMALLTTLFAASLWGWLSFGLPAGLAGGIGSVRGRGWFTDAFLLGVFATLLAASCSAPFVGTALGFALARGPLDIALVFAALGLGMAAPFLAVAAAPRLVAWLPRPGPWMIWLQRVLGLLLLGTAVWLLSVLALETSPGTAVTAGAALAVLLAVLAWRRRRPSRRIRAGAVAAVLAAVAVLVPSLHGAAVSTDPPAPKASAELWQPFDTGALHRAVAERKIVFVDVTAAWCLTCKLNELNVLDREPVVDRLRSSGVIAMRADWTRPDPAVTAYLQSFGRYGVPLNVVYGPGAPEGIALPELLTQGAVMDAFRRAGGANHEAAAE